VRWGKFCFLGYQNLLLLFFLTSLVHTKDFYSRNYFPVLAEGNYLWLGTEKGLFNFNFQTQRWEKFTCEDGLVSNKINDLAVRKDELWVATPEGVCKWEARYQKWEVYQGSEYLPSDKVSCLDCDEDTVFIGTDEGVSYLELEDNKWTIYTTEDGLIDNKVRACLLDGDEVWIGTSSGISLFHLEFRTFENFTIKEGLLSNQIKEIKKYHQIIWVVTDKGISLYDLKLKNWTSLSLKEELKGTKIIAIRGSGTLVWILTDKALYYYEPLQQLTYPFPYFEELSQLRVVDFEVTKDKIFFATNEGVYSFTRATRSFDTPQTKKDGLLGNKLEAVFFRQGMLFTLLAEGLSWYEVERQIWWSKLFQDFEKKHQPKEEAKIYLNERGLNFKWLPRLISTHTGEYEIRTRSEGNKLKPEFSLHSGNFLELLTGGKLSSFFKYDFYSPTNTELTGEIRYEGTKEAKLKEIVVGNDLDYVFLESQLLDEVNFTGLQNKWQGKWIKFALAAGLENGEYYKEIFKELGEKKAVVGYIFTLDKANLIYGSDEVKIDRRELERNRDYIIIYSSGHLCFLDDTLLTRESVIEVKYAYTRRQRSQYFIPGDKEIGDWRTEGGRREYSKERLYDEINGAAPFYVEEHGCQRTIFQDYKQTSTGLEASVMFNEMTDEQDAQNIFEAKKESVGKYEYLPGIKNEAIICKGEYDTSIYFWQEKYFVEITIYGSGEEIEKQIYLFALVINQGVAAGRKEFVSREEFVGLTLEGTLANFALGANFQSERKEKGTVNTTQLFSNYRLKNLELSLEALNSQDLIARQFGWATSLKASGGGERIKGKIKFVNYGPDFKDLELRKAFYVDQDAFAYREQELDIESEIFPLRILPVEFWYNRSTFRTKEAKESRLPSEDKMVRISFNPKRLPNIGFSLTQSSLTYPVIINQKVKNALNFQYNLGKLLKINSLLLKVTRLETLTKEVDRETNELSAQSKELTHYYTVNFAPSPNFNFYGDWETTSEKRKNLKLNQRDELKLGFFTSLLPGVALSLSSEILAKEDFFKRRGVRLKDLDLEGWLQGQIDLFPGRYFSLLTPFSLNGNYLKQIKNRYTFLEPTRGVVNIFTQEKELNLEKHPARETTISLGSGIRARWSKILIELTLRREENIAERLDKTEEGVSIYGCKDSTQRFKIDFYLSPQDTLILEHLGQQTKKKQNIMAQTTTSLFNPRLEWRRLFSDFFLSKTKFQYSLRKEFNQELLFKETSCSLSQECIFNFAYTPLAWDWEIILEPILGIKSSYEETQRRVNLNFYGLNFYSLYSLGENIIFDLRLNWTSSQEIRSEIRLRMKY
jgi:hypothetical protein